MRILLTFPSLFFMSCMCIFTDIHVDREKLYTPINLFIKDNLNTNTEYDFSSIIKYCGRYETFVSIYKFSIDVDTSYKMIILLKILNDNKTIEKQDTMIISAETANTSFFIRAPSEANTGKLTNFKFKAILFSNDTEKQSSFSLDLKAQRIHPFLR